MSASLKQEVIKGLKTEDALNMADFGYFEELRTARSIPGSARSCHTACCLAGHIVAAAKRIGMPIPTSRQLRDVPGGTDEFGHVDYERVPKAARALWASVYGQKSARKLAFYPISGRNLHSVKPEEVVAHVRGEEATW